MPTILLPPNTRAASTREAAADHTQQHDYLYWEFNGWIAVRQGKWRAVKPDKRKTWELYDIASDPGESNDALQPDILARLTVLAELAHQPVRKRLISLCQQRRWVVSHLRMCRWHVGQFAGRLSSRDGTATLRSSVGVVGGDSRQTEQLRATRLRHLMWRYRSCHDNGMSSLTRIVSPG